MAKLDAMNALKIQKDQVDGILQAGRKEDASSWLRNWRYERGIPVDSGVMPGVDEVPLYYRPYLFPRADASPQDGMKIAHHTGGKHFTEPSIDELIQGLINGDVPRGTLGDEETENRMIQEYLDMQKQSLKIST